MAEQNAKKPVAPGQTDRQQRLARQLRANLKKRRSQKQGRKKLSNPAEAKADGPEAKAVDTGGDDTETWTG